MGLAVTHLSRGSALRPRVGLCDLRVHFPRRERALGKDRRRLSVVLLSGTHRRFWRGQRALFAAAPKRRAERSFPQCTGKLSSVRLSAVRRGGLCAAGDAALSYLVRLS